MTPGITCATRIMTLQEPQISKNKNKKSNTLKRARPEEKMKTNEIFVSKIFKFSG